jgi:FHS family glucose/mannose:H+ symporter-like MFS transporter
VIAAISVIAYELASLDPQRCFPLMSSNKFPVAGAEQFGVNRATALIYSSFVLAGVVTTLLGPMLPLLMARWSMTDERAGLFFTFQFFGNLAGIATLGPLLTRSGYGRTFVIGFISIGAGIAGLNSANEFVCLASTAFFGYGLGLILSGVNLWAAEVAGARRTAALSVLNVAWGIGAISCPALVLMAHQAHRLPILIFGIAGLSAVAAIAIAAMNIEPRAHRQDGDGMLATAPRAGKKFTFALGGLFFLYIGTEGCIGGWTASLAKRMGNSGGNLWELAPMFFWAGLLSGRAIAPAILRRISERSLFAGGLILAGSFSAALWWADSFRGIAICVALTGLGLSTIYPLIISWMVGHFGAETKRVGSVMFALASVGGAILPAAVGYTSTHTGSLRAGLLVPFFAFGVMLGFWGMMRESGEIR